MTQLQCPIFLFFILFYQFIFQNYNVLVISRLQWLIWPNGKSCKNLQNLCFFFKFRFWGFGALQPPSLVAPLVKINCYKFLTKTVLFEAQYLCTFRNPFLPNTYPHCGIRGCHLATVKITVFWNVTPCVQIIVPHSSQWILVEICRYSRKFSSSFDKR
jgi:hypothetical protein